MTVYALRTTVQNEEAIIDFSGDTRAIADVFIHGRRDLASLSGPLRAVAQAGYTAANLPTTDFIAASQRVPVFSKRFVETLGDALASDLEFAPCVIECEGQPFEAYAGRIRQSLSLVDASRSEYRKLVSGGTTLLKAVYRSTFDAEFLIARDTESRARYVASERFKTLCEAQGLRIEFGQPV